MREAALLDVDGLTRDYGGAGLFGRAQPVRALDTVSLSIRRGEVLGIVGESGCGKSTLARLVMALDRPTGGTVRLAGDDLFSLGASDLARRRRDFQMVFQDPYGSLDPRQSVGRIVAEPLHVVEPRPNSSERRRRVGEVLESVGLRADDARRYPHEFSGGQRQRIAIARALATRPKLLVADEAVSALDLSVQAQVLNLLMDLQEEQDLTILFISHDLAVVETISDRIAVMYLGRVVETGDAREVFERPLHPYTRLLAEAEPSIDRLGAPARREGPSAEIPKTVVGGCAFRPRCPLASNICAAEKPPLRAVAPGRYSACHHAEAMPGFTPPAPATLQQGIPGAP